MKKLIFILIMLMAVSAYAETSKYGSMWKQEDTTLLPADDITAVDVSGVTFSNGGGGDFSNITGEVNFNLGATESVYINASTIHHTGTDGALRIDVIPDADSVRAIQSNINANGYNDIMAHSVDYIADGMTGTDQGMAIEVNVTDGTATGGFVDGIRMTDDTVSGVSASAVFAGTNVAPIRQLSGVAVYPAVAFTYYTSFATVTNSFNNATSNVPIFSEYSSFVYIGHTAIFSEAIFTLATSASATVDIDWEYWSGADWDSFGPNDTSTGLTSSGSITWDSAALTGWTSTTVNGSDNYYIRGLRNAAVLATVPVESTVAIVTGTTYTWGSSGDITAYDMMLQGTYGAGAGIDVSGAGTRCFWYPKKAAWRCGIVDGAGAAYWDEASIGEYSHATGRNTRATGPYSYAEGFSTIAQGTTSHAEGNATNASGSTIGAHAEGQGTTATGWASHAEGHDTTASGNYSHSEGADTTALGGSSHAEGSATLASGSNSHAEGNLTVASGSSAHAEGFFTTASGTNGSHSQGERTVAAGQTSHAGGYHSYADASYSFVNGNYLRVTGGLSVMFGDYANATERDANPLSFARTMKLANMSLIVDGRVAFSGMTSIGADYTIEDDIFFVECDATLGNISTVFPSYSTLRGRMIEVKKIDASANGCYLDGAGAETIDGATGQAITTQYNVISVIAGALEWLIR